MRRPDKVVATGVAQMSRGHHRCFGLRQVFLDRDDLTAATPLERPGAIVFVEQEILQRPQQERAKPALLLVRAGQTVLLEQMSEKTLAQVLGISGRKTAVAKKTVERRPVRLTKSGQRLVSGFLCLFVPRTQNDRPMRRLKR